MVVKEFGGAMTIENPQQGAIQNRVGIVSQGAFDKASKFFAFKEAMIFSIKDYVIVFCISCIVVVVVYSNFMKFFHGLSEEQLMEMLHKNFHGTFLENLKGLFLGQIAWDEIYKRELWNTASWESVWAFICLIPQMIFGTFQILFPIIFVFHFILHGALKDMIQQGEKSLE
ncbi:hypothetical protein [Bartonella birtlesii]|uniref:hypothetical protein n=1 Tax=Bartonella birtlesii TaxID=111504 RepID=UPI001F0A2154|nr:hypothetical protein [Bartonella birtlesii]